jgi:hypothetical protein
LTTSIWISKQTANPFFVIFLDVFGLSMSQL